ncbi:MAG: DUF4258 domain-containing protein [Patescibacteria group bacterium]
MKIILTAHARVRMEGRKISQREIEECVLRPDKTHREGEKICRFQKSFEHGTIEVVAQTKGNYFIVVTVYPL